MNLYVYKGLQSPGNPFCYIPNINVLNYLLELIRLINAQISTSVGLAPKHTLIIRQRVFLYLLNGLCFNVNYKDTGNTNFCHMTTFSMYPLERQFCLKTTNEKGLRYYNIFQKLFDNSLLINNGYIKHCFEYLIASKHHQSSPFITKRDFYYALFYFIMTGHMSLSEILCKRYRYSSPSNFFSYLFDLFSMLTSPLECIPSNPGNIHDMCLSQHDLGVCVVYHDAIENIRLWNKCKLHAIAQHSSLIPLTAIEYNPVYRNSSSLLLRRRGGFICYSSNIIGLLVLNIVPSRNTVVFCTQQGNIYTFNSILHFLRILIKANITLLKILEIITYPEQRCRE